VGGKRIFARTGLPVRDLLNFGALVPFRLRAQLFNKEREGCPHTRYQGYDGSSGKPGQRKVKGGSFIHLPLRPHPATVAPDDVLNYGQTHAGAFKFGPTMQGLEDAEQFIDIPHIKADPVILDVVDVLIFFGPAG
jgi:hypothetical protein